MFFTHTDAVVGDLAFSRTFNSGRTNGIFNGSGVFGPGWNSSFEARLTFIVNKPTLVARSPQGDAQYYYDPDGNGWFDAVLPFSTESWVEGSPSTGYRRFFRAGGEEVYDSAGKLVSVVERSGLTTAYARDSQGRLSSVSRLGRAITIAYVGVSTRPDQILGPGNTLLAKYTYDTSGRLEKVEYPDGGQWSGYQYGYDGVGRVLGVTDLEGKKVEAHTYDPATGRATTSEIGDGVERLTFSYQTNKTIVTDALGNETTYDYANVRGIRQVTKTTGPCSSCGGQNGDVQEWAYDGNGRTTSYKDGEGNLTTYTYDQATGDLLTETRKPDPDTSLVTSYTYHADGRLNTRTDPRQALTTWTYQQMHADEKQTIHQPMNSTQNRQTILWRNSMGKPRLIQDPRGQLTEMFYTPQGDLDYIKDPAGKETHFTYDLLGRRTQTTNPPTTPAALEPIHEYNVRGQVKRIIDPTDANKYTLITYDRGGRRIEVRDALLRRTEYVYDLYGRLEFVKRWLSEETSQNTQFHYDTMSNMDWIEDARGKRTTFEYDGHNRVTKILYPSDSTEVRAEEFTYDGAGRLKTRKDRRGITTTYTYDGLGRLIGKSYAGGTVAGSPVTFGYDGSGNLILADSGSGAHTWSYNLTGEPDSVGQQVPPLPLVSTSFVYDDAGNRINLSTNSGLSLTYDYDTVGRPWHIFRGSDTFTFQYDDASRRRSLTYPNGVVTNLTPDTLSRLDVLETIQGAQTLRFDYSYDDVGNRLSKATPTVNETYTYDAVYQLDTVRRNSTLTDDFGHDPVGNRTATLTLPNPAQWVYSNRNELLAMGTASQSYDLNGNMTGKSDATGVWTYEWDVENHLARVTRDGAEVATYKYDGFGRRVEKLIGEVRTTYVYDGEDILRERVGPNSRHFVHGPGTDEPLARVVGTTVTYFHPDGLGSIVSRTDGMGAVVYSRSYDAFGNLETGSSEAGYAFTGREWDPETGLYYYRARYYDPKVGRFVSEDPIGLAGGINLYAYALNNPANRTDPFGLDSVFDPNMFRPWQSPPCQMSPCMRKCLQKVMGTPPQVTITPNARNVASALGFAVSGPGSISLPGSCEAFFSSPPWVLHEYQHVTQHWTKGTFRFLVSYVANPNPWDDDADAFAQRMAPILQQCLDDCRPCK